MRMSILRGGAVAQPIKIIERESKGQFNVLKDRIERLEKSREQMLSELEQRDTDIRKLSHIDRDTAKHLETLRHKAGALDSQVRKLEFGEESLRREWDLKLTSLDRDLNSRLKQGEEKNLAETGKLALADSKLQKRLEILEVKALVASRLDELSERLTKLEIRPGTRWNRFWRRFLLGIE